MIQEKNRFMHDRLYISILFCLLLTNTFVRIYNDTLNVVGDVSISLTFILMFFLLLTTWIDNNVYPVSLQRIYLTLTLLIVVFTISFLNSAYMELYSFLQLLFLFLYILGSVRLKWTAEYIRIGGYILGFAVIAYFIHWLSGGLPLRAFKTIYSNENYFAALLFGILYFNLLAINFSRHIGRIFFSIILLMNLILIFTSSSRSALIGIVVVLSSWFLLHWRKSFFKKLLYIALAGSFLFIGFYVGLQHLAIGHTLNEISYSITGKNLFSGRTEIWEGVIRSSLSTPILGNGVGVNAPDLIETDLNTHNMYIQLFSEVGFIGLLLFIILVISIWNVLMKRLDHYTAKWSACFLVGFIVYNTFEMTMLQNNYSVAAVQWLVMTIGISFTEGGEK